MNSTNSIINKAIFEAKIGYLPRYVLDFDKRFYVNEITESDIIPEYINLQNKTVTLNTNVTDYMVYPDVGYQGLGTVEIDTNIDTVTANIESVKNYTVTSPQSTNIVPSEGYDAMSRVFLQYNVPHQSKSVTIRSNGTTSVYPDNGYYGLTGVTIETDVPAQTLAPKICYIGVHNDTSIIGAIIDVGNEIWDVGSSVMVPDGKTLIVLDYDDPPTKLNVIAYYNVAGGTGESRVHLGSNSYYKIFNYTNLFISIII